MFYMMPIFSRAFGMYLEAAAPALLYSQPMDMLSFRWKVISDEFLTGWTSPQSGIDIITELLSDEVCGFIGINFQGMEFLQHIAAEHEEPYHPLLIVEELQRHLKGHGETLGRHYERILHEAGKASKAGCVLKYIDNDVLRPIVMTRHEILARGAVKAMAASAVPQA